MSYATAATANFNPTAIPIGHHHNVVPELFNLLFATNAGPRSSSSTDGTNGTNHSHPQFTSNSFVPPSSIYANFAAPDTWSPSSSPSLAGGHYTFTTTTTTTDETTTTTTAGSDSVALLWAELVLGSVLCVLIVITVIGNTLVILAVVTTRRLRTVTNCFVMSLAVADWLVGIFVMPPAVAVHLIGSWELGWILCDIWISLDVLLCTASILSLCAISIDRYLAVTQPLVYSRRRRSKRLALIMILIVWVLALAITCPPILGWYEQGRRDLHECRYNQNEGYVIFSAMGSFFIPMAVMIYVYVRISCVVAKRHDHMHGIEMHKTNHRPAEADVADLELEQSSDQEFPSPYRRRGAGGGDPNNAPSSSSTQSTPLYVRHTPAHTGRQSHGGTHRNGQYELVSSGGAGAAPPSTRGGHRAAHHHQQSIVLHAEPNAAAGSGTIISAKPAATCIPSKSVHHCVGAGHTTRTALSGGVHTATIRAHPHQPTTTTTTTTGGVHSKSMSHRITSMKRENKTTQTLSIVVGGFIVCWLPFFVYYLITPFLPHEQVSGNMTNCLTWLGWFNSAMNPFIYAFYSIDFRAAFWRLTLRRFFKNSVKAPYTSAVSIRR